MTNNLRTIICTVTAFILGCIICTAGLEHEYDARIEELELDCHEAIEAYDNYVEYAELVTENFAEYAESQYDDLLDVAEDMALDLDIEGLPVPEYDDSDLMDKWEEDSVLAEELAEYIFDHCNMGD